MNDKPMTFSQMCAVYRAAGDILKGHIEDDVVHMEHCCNIENAVYDVRMHDVVARIIHFAEVVGSNKRK
ncbi:hypothetical protein E2F50_00160 [Rhizobium deserti]|uniref:Uncharacterized protein n=1 Tax=Rhizobium deserti TaxID=2547961 RepID=A0A4R5ULM5_9HYPH|nr:hypothetical protein [Rhizobium deserti]TDK38614.1 hypothetical protein E2F50_00160 [Rhizobium deserti]